MKRIQYILAMAAVTVISSISAFGQQNLRTAYFLDGYTYNYKMNPAMAPERAFFAMPMIGNMGIGAESNMALSTFLYPTGNGNMTTFMNKSVSADQFLDRIQQVNNLNISTNTKVPALPPMPLVKSKKYRQHKYPISHPMVQDGIVF